MAIIRDILSGEIVAFNIGNHHDADLVLKTLKEAVVKTGKPPKIFHSDRGRNFVCTMYPVLEHQRYKFP